MAEAYLQGRLIGPFTAMGTATNQEIPMDRPMCKTCPYHYVFDPEDWGECRRNPPFIGEDLEAEWPIINTDAVSFCGEHPDFPAWLASREASGT